MPVRMTKLVSVDRSWPDVVVEGETPVDEGSASGRLITPGRVALVAVTAIITTATALAGNALLARLSARSPALEYELVSTPTLFGSLRNSRIFTLTVDNVGRRDAAEVSIGLSVEAVEGATIEEHEVQAPPALSVSEDVLSEGRKLIVRSPALNPSDKIAVSVLVKYGSAQAGPSVDVRARGVTGRPRATGSAESGSNPLAPTLAAVLAATIGVLSASFLALSRSARRVLGIRSQVLAARSLIADEPRHVVFANAALQVGEIELAREFLDRGETRWWIESDYVTTRALRGAEGDPSVTSSVAILQHVLQQDGVADGARARILVNLARLACRYDDGAARDYLVHASRHDRDEFDRALGDYPELVVLARDTAVVDSSEPGPTAG